MTGMSPIVPVGELLSVAPVHRPPGRLVPVGRTEFPDGRDPVITQLLAEVLVWDCRDVVDMDVTMDNCQTVPDVIKDRAVVAMVGLYMAWVGEETPMDCNGEYAEWDIHNEFETVDGMPVYYGGDLHDSDESDWEDPCDLAYAEYVDRYNFDAPEGMELKVFERLQGPDGPVMMVGEVTGSRHVQRTLSSGSLLEADMVCKAPMADILTVRHNVPELTGSPIRRSSSETDGGAAALYYEGDLSDSEDGLVKIRERDTREDWCDSAFRNGYGGFPLDTDDPLPPVVFSSQLFWDEDIAELSRMLSDCGDVPVSALQGFADTAVPLVPPDTDRIVRFDNNELALMDSRIGEVSVLSLEIFDPSIHSDTLDVGISDGDTEWLCLLYFASSGVRGTIPLQLDWTVWGWIIREGSSGTQVLWVNNAYMCGMIASA